MTWAMATRATTCGYCRELIRSGALVLLVSQANLVRCRTCAKRSFNEDPPSLPPPAPPPPPPLTFATPKGLIAKWVRDFKIAQSGES